MNALTKAEPKPMLLDLMASKAGLRPDEFSATVRKTCGMVNASAEEFAAFLMVANEYNLNPLLKEIYAFPAKGGGIVPIVSIDGWVNLVNSHPACDGFEFDVEHDDKGELVSITCRMYRKDRNRPVSVREYYEECKRGTEPWKMKHRMLRHKAMIQAARYAFGFSGIYDEDEGAKIAEMRDVTPKATPVPPKPPVPPKATAIEVSSQSEPTVQGDILDGEIVDGDTGEIIEESNAGQTSSKTTAATTDDEQDDDTEFFERLEEAMASAPDLETLEELWAEFDPLARFDGKQNGETNQSIALAIRKRAEKRIGSGK